MCLLVLVRCACVLLQSRICRGFGRILLPVRADGVAMLMDGEWSAREASSGGCDDVTLAMFSLEFDCSELCDWRRVFFTRLGGLGLGRTLRALFGVTFTCMKWLTLEGSLRSSSLGWPVASVASEGCDVASFELTGGVDCRRVAAVDALFVFGRCAKAVADLCNECAWFQHFQWLCVSCL